MPNRRSPKKLEERIARQYVYKHSVLANRNNDPNEISERIYTGKEEDIAGEVLAKRKELEIKTNAVIDHNEIPVYPQGLVFTDSRGEGYFDIHF
jgi:hypothetical protein